MKLATSIWPENPEVMLKAKWSNVEVSRTSDTGRDTIDNEKEQGRVSRIGEDENSVALNSPSNRVLGDLIDAEIVTLDCIQLDSSAARIKTLWTMCANIVPDEITRTSRDWVHDKSSMTKLGSEIITRRVLSSGVNSRLESRGESVMFD